MYDYEGYPPWHAQPEDSPVHAAAHHTALVAIDAPPLSPGQWHFLTVDEVCCNDGSHSSTQLLMQ